uniref:Fumarylacetoacetate hydrolase domain containing 2A n=1 Tax=Strix occidentalis caurina TaxID=311401 RepID=A0A8D0FCF5_STROC
MRLLGAMRLVRFRGAGGAEPRLGLEAAGGSVVDLSAAEPALPRSMRAFLESGPSGLAAAQRALESGRHRVPRGTVQLLAPIGDPEKVICVGLNYHDHCLEQDLRSPQEPIIFSKFPSAIIGPFDDIIHPEESSEVDWEVELAAVIGKKGRHIEESSALDHVVGFTVANDVSARDWQRRNGRQWLLSKTFDTFCPLGPALVTKEAVAGGDRTGRGRGQDGDSFPVNRGGIRHQICPKAAVFPKGGGSQWQAAPSAVPVSPPTPGVTRPLCPHRRPQPEDPLQRQRAADAGQQHQPAHLPPAQTHRLGLPVSTGWGGQRGAGDRGGHS